MIIPRVTARPLVHLQYYMIVKVREIYYDKQKNKTQSRSATFSPQQGCTNATPASSPAPSGRSKADSADNPPISPYFTTGLIIPWVTAKLLVHLRCYTMHSPGPELRGAALPHWDGGRIWQLHCVRSWLLQELHCQHRMHHVPCCHLCRQ